MFIHSTVDKHLDYFQFEAIMNSAAINIIVRLLVNKCTIGVVICLGV